jgi:two-component system response regulator PilR (NtrC family)
MTVKKIGIVEDDPFLRQQIALSLSKEYEVVEAGDRIAGEKMLLIERPELLLVDLHLPPSGKSSEGIKLIEAVKQNHMDTVVIVMSADADMKAILKAVDTGAYDYFKKPFDFTELRLIIRRALEKQAIQRENERLQSELQTKYSFENIVGQSPEMMRVFDAIKRVSSATASVIIRGESGTGKELIARAIHYNSKRSHQPFISVNCAALPETLVETELFGHEKGAFTGAVSSHSGRFELADGGTLFLDEIGSISLPVQAKLLRVLEERCFQRIGGTRNISTDVRLVTATNEDLEKKVSDQQFREDLYYRINVFPLHVPSLRDRREDIPLLLDHFLRIFCAENKVPFKQFHPSALSSLTSYIWKGNVRELENLVQTLVLMTDAETIELKDLPAYISSSAPSQPASHIPSLPLSNGIELDKAVDQFEYELIQKALRDTDGVKTKAADLLKIDRNRMKYLCRKHNL